MLQNKTASKANYSTVQLWRAHPAIEGYDFARHEKPLKFSSSFSVSAAASFKDQSKISEALRKTGRAACHRSTLLQQALSGIVLDLLSTGPSLYQPM
ncbi:hypothetical protein AOLI_G00078040 [Acnodon oligacanthus]